MQKKLVRNAGGLSYQRNPLNWLILGGVFLIASIVVGTTFTVISFRQRALNNSERELENTVLLLARHFDRELNNFETVQKEIVRRIQMTGVASPEAFKRQMSGVEVHKALQAEIAVAPDVSGINVFDANGELINSSQSWPIPTISIADRTYFKDFSADQWSPVVLYRGRRFSSASLISARLCCFDNPRHAEKPVPRIKATVIDPYHPKA